MINKWLFFDVGSTIMDESKAIRERINSTVEVLRGTPDEISWAGLAEPKSQEYQADYIVNNLSEIMNINLIK